MLGWPSAPPVSVAPPQEKDAIVSVVVILLPDAPAAVASTVTVAVLELAVRVDDEILRLIAAAKLVAALVVVFEVSNEVPVLVPAAPPVRVLPAHVNPEAIVVARVMLFPAVPGTEAVTVTWFVLLLPTTPLILSMAV